MLIPAIVKKEEILESFKNYFFTTDMMYETGYLDSWVPEILENPDSNTYQYAIVDKNKNLIGYFAYQVDWYSSNAYNFGLFSFDRGNIIVGVDVFSEITKLINEYKLHRIEWRMIGGNPVEKSYDNLLKKFNGTKHVFRDVIKDRYGKYHDSIVYEIVIGERNV